MSLIESGHREWSTEQNCIFYQETSSTIWRFGVSVSETICMHGGIFYVADTILGADDIAENKMERALDFEKLGRGRQ